MSEVVKVGRTPPLFGMERPHPTNDDWYTPVWIFEAMNLVFDIDVAAPPGGVPWIPADKFYTQADDGLAQPWVGRIWCNPPFSKAAAWARRFIEHGHGVFLGPWSAAYWPHDLVAAADTFWIPDHKLDFQRADGTTSSAIAYPIWLAAIGSDCAQALERLPRGVTARVNA